MVFVGVILNLVFVGVIINVRGDTALGDPTSHIAKQ
jgi:hypothetical protein